MEYGRGMKLLWLTLVLAASVVSGRAWNAQTARAFATKTDLANISTALKLFDDDCGRYPTTAEGLDSLFHRPPNVPPEKWHGAYLTGVRTPGDPWDHPYVYRCPGVHNTNTFDLYSCGPDGKSAGEGDDPDDINNWNPASPLVRVESHYVTGGRAIIYGLGAVVILLFLAIQSGRQPRKYEEKWNG
jgi:general secretion pathway protein G